MVDTWNCNKSSENGNIRYVSQPVRVIFVEHTKASTIEYLPRYTTTKCAHENDQMLDLTKPRRLISMLFAATAGVLTCVDLTN